MKLNNNYRLKQLFLSYFKKSYIPLLFFIISCNQNANNTIVDEKHSAPPESKEKKCALDSNVRSFKNLTLGMDVSELKNIKPTKEFACSVDFEDSGNSKFKVRKSEEKIEEPEGVKSYEVFDKYTAFEKKVKHVFVRFYKNKLFKIKIQTEEHLISELKDRYNIHNECIEKLSEFRKKSWSLFVSNEKTLLSCYPSNLLDFCADTASYSIDIADVEISRIVNNIKPAPNKKKLNDF